MIDDASATVSLWEALATAQPPARGAVVLVALGGAATYGEACEQPLSLCAGAALAELRRRGGDAAETIITCTNCGTMLDVPLDLGDFSKGPTPSQVDLGDVRVRAPTTRDLLQALDTADPAAALRELCVEGTVGDAARPLPPKVDAAVEELCGVAAIAIRAECANCSGPLSAEVDLVELLAAKVTDDAAVILRGVAEIAAAFGWSEAAILGLSPVRREQYLGLARALGGRA